MFNRIAKTSYVLIALIAMSWAGNSSVARAELNIAVVDVDKVLTDSKAAISVQKQVNKKRESFMSQVKAEEDKLRDEQKAIEAKRSEISKEELIKKAQEFEKRRLDARTKIQDKKKELDQAYTEAMNILTKSIYGVCQTLADDRGIDLVITRQNIIVGNMSLDITEEVIQQLNKKLPNISL